MKLRSREPAAILSATDGRPDRPAVPRAVREARRDAPRRRAQGRDDAVHLARRPYFSFLADGGTLSLRLPVDALATFLAKYRTRLSEQHGAVMKEYAVVPAALLRKTAELAEWFAQSHAYVAALPPKAPAGARKSGAK